MFDRECISNDALWDKVHPLDRPFPCRRRGRTRDGVRLPQGHYASCSDTECRGCVPRPATNGYLCQICWGSLLDALNRAPELVTHLRSVERSGQALGERVATSMERSILIPNSWAAADSIMDALGAPKIPSTADIDETAARATAAVTDWTLNADSWVNTREGAKRALVLMRRMRVALRQFPDSEAEWRKIPELRCQDCKHPNLYRKAPAFFGDDCVVECVTDGCTYQRDWWEWVEVFAPIFEYIVAAQERRRPRPVLKRVPRASEECEAGNHTDCQHLDCRCQCHLDRRFSLYTNPLPAHLRNAS